MFLAWYGHDGTAVIKVRCASVAGTWAAKLSWKSGMSGVEETTDQQLVDQVMAGNKNVFNLLVMRYQHRVAALIARFVQDPQEVEDVAQEAFIKAYRALPLFRGDSAFYTWLYRIAVNTAKNHLVARSRRPPAHDLEIDEVEPTEIGSVLHEIESPEGSLSTNELKNAIEAAVDSLPEELKTAFTLREFSGLSYEDITEVMDCPVGTVRSRIFRAREAIDRKIKELL